MSKQLLPLLLLSLALTSCSNSPTENAESTAVETASDAPAEAPVDVPVVVAADSPAPDPDAPKIPDDTEIVTTESGLKYSVLSKGDGTRTANIGDRISMHYTGWLLDGTMFDSSRKSGRPYSFSVGSGVIAGWSEAAQHMGLGDRLKLTIPPSLAYGTSGSPPVIPGDATLIFEVELVEATFMPAFHAGTIGQQTTTESGLVYEFLSAGAGAMPVDGDVVELKYAIWDDGESLLACDEQTGQLLKGSCGDLPYDFMSEAAMLMPVGARVRLIVAPELAPAPPGAPQSGITVWELELVSISAPLPIPEFDMPAPEDLTTTESGLAYRVDTAGTGEPASMGQQLTVHYAGWLADGTLFDASFKRGEPLDFQLHQGGLIAGWIEGLQLMNAGAVYTFVIPAELAYGEQGRPSIPANSVLVFEITMVAVEG